MGDGSACDKNLRPLAHGDSGEFYEPTLRRLEPHHVDRHCTRVEVVHDEQPRRVVHHQAASPPQQIRLPCRANDSCLSSRVRLRPSLREIPPCLDRPVLWSMPRRDRCRYACRSATGTSLGKASLRQSASTIRPASNARGGASADIGTRRRPLVIESLRFRRGRNASADCRARLTDAGAPCLAGRLSGKIAQQGRQTDAARAGLSLQLVAHVVVEPDRDRGAHA